MVRRCLRALEEGLADFEQLDHLTVDLRHPTLQLLSGSRPSMEPPLPNMPLQRESNPDMQPARPPSLTHRPTSGESPGEAVSQVPADLFGSGWDFVPSYPPPPPPTTDFERKYPSDLFGEEASENARVWRIYRDEVTAVDKCMLDGWNKILDILLIFAGLFSSALLAFIVESYKMLQPDYTEYVPSALYSALSACDSNGALNLASDRHASGVPAPDGPQTVATDAAIQEALTNSLKRHRLMILRLIQHCRELRGREPEADVAARMIGAGITGHRSAETTVMIVTAFREYMTQIGAESKRMGMCKKCPKPTQTFQEVEVKLPALSENRLPDRPNSNPMMGTPSSVACPGATKTAKI
ncbi:hypothetical protein AURDEDRAFT_125777 [Auricularia subglabra TFB-10046 SS5]|nr:hypothetical protein AURDEDRAFT_125777 [Auricularia subglabra TFB-10046 SS5]